MAKIELSALLNAIRGRLGGAVYVKSKGIDYVRLVSTSTLDPKTARNLQIRANFGTASAGFASLTPGQQDLWREFANLKRHSGGAKAAYISLSCNLLNASHSDPVINPGPPDTPGTPRFPKHFCVTTLSENTTCLSWTEPDNVTSWVTGHFRVHRGFCIVHPCFETCKTGSYSHGSRFVLTERADSLSLQHVHDYPYNTRLYYHLNSIDRSGRKSPVTHDIGITTTLDHKVFIGDCYNHRVVVRSRDDLSFLDKVGTSGSGNDQFSFPYGVAVDTTYFYVSDGGNDRIVKRRKSDLSFVAKCGTLGSGDGQFDAPRGIAVDDTFLYISDANNHRIVKLKKSDLSFVAKIGTNGSGNDQFNYPSGICLDGSYIYIADSSNSRIVKRKKTDLSFVAKIGTQGSGNDQFNKASGVCISGPHIFIADHDNNRIKKHLASTLAYVSKIGSLGSGNDQFSYPRGIGADLTHIYVTDSEQMYAATPNHRLNKRLASDLSFVQLIGGKGSGNDQFNFPTGAGIQTRYS